MSANSMQPRRHEPVEDMPSRSCLRCQALRQTQITGLDVDAVESCADGKILDDSLEA